MDDPHQNVVFALGGPGSHLPSHCNRIAKEFGHTLINTSELLRAEMKRGSVLGKEIESAVQNNELVPTETIIACMKAKMKRSGSNKFLIQGYPRTLKQAFAFERNIAPVNKVLYFECSAQMQEQRLIGVGYVDPAEVEEEKARITAFYDNTLEVVQFYQKAGNLVTIDDNVDQEQSYPQVPYGGDGKKMASDRTGCDGADSSYNPHCITWFYIKHCQDIADGKTLGEGYEGAALEKINTLSADECDANQDVYAYKKYSADPKKWDDWLAGVVPSPDSFSALPALGLLLALRA